MWPYLFRGRDYHQRIGLTRRFGRDLNRFPETETVPRDLQPDEWEEWGPSPQIREAQTASALHDFINLPNHKYKQKKQVGSPTEREHSLDVWERRWVMGRSLQPRSPHSTSGSTLDAKAVRPPS